MRYQSRGSIASRIFTVALALIGCSSLCCAQETDTTAVDLPEGRAVYDHYLEATGGKEKFANLKSSRMTGKMQVQGMEAPIVIHRDRPGKLTVNIVFEGFGEVSQGTNGDIAWDVSPMRGARILEGAEKEEMMKRADFDEELNPDKYYQSIECTAEGEHDNRKCYIVEFTDKSDNVEKRFFDAESHLLVKVETQRDTPLGNMNVVSELSDYRDVDGVKMAFKNEMTVMGTSQVIQFDEIAFDVELDANAFDPPEAVVKLLEKKKAQAAEQADEAAES